MVKQLCLLVVSLVAFVGVPVLSLPPNPCPENFSYIHQSKGGIEGLITLPFVYGPWLKIQVNATMNGYFGEHNSHMDLKMLTSASELFYKETSYVRYRLKFPVQDSIPRITQIVLNGRIFCSGPPDPAVAPGPGVTQMYSEREFQFTDMAGPRQYHKLPFPKRVDYYPEAGGYYGI